MGPGLAIKAVAGRHFSVMSFGIAQVAMDIEPLIAIFTGSGVLHGDTHTYLAALPIAIAAALISPPICRPILRRWNKELSYHRLGWLVEPEAFAPLPVFLGALVGTLSHVALDGIMHADTRPLMPWSGGNGLYGLLPYTAIHLLCIFAGVLGAAGWAVRGWLARRGATG